MTAIQAPLPLSSSQFSVRDNQPGFGLMEFDCDKVVISCLSVSGVGVSLSGLM